MRLPGAERAEVDIVKLRAYCLNTKHPEEKHKARVFRAALGLDAEHAEELRAALLNAARTTEAIPGMHDGYGSGSWSISPCAVASERPKFAPPGLFVPVRMLCV